MLCLDRRSAATRLPKKARTGGAQTATPKTLYRGHLERHVFPKLGHRWLHEIREEEIVGLISELRAKGLSAYAIRGVLVPLGRILSNAVRRKLIPSNPIAN